MATGYYLLDNPPTLAQYGFPRRDGVTLSGTLELHSFEAPADWDPPDTGAERGAAYVRSRTDRLASYSAVVDSDSVVLMVPPEYETWHDTVTNRWAYGSSWYMQAHTWDDAPTSWVDGALTQMARHKARIATHIKDRYGISVPARFLTRDEAHARRPGFVLHGVSDPPPRRTDPWVGHPHRERLESRFLDLYRAAYNTTPTATIPEEDDMPTIILARQKGSPRVYMSGDEGTTRRWVRTSEELADLKWQAAQRGTRVVDRGEVDRIDWLGVDVTPVQG